MGAATSSFRNAAELPALVSYVRERRCVLFVGAGLSRPAGYPGWGDLMGRLVSITRQRHGPATNAQELRALVKQGKFAEVADECRRLLGRARFGTELRAILDKPVEPPEATHQAIVRTPWACIVTTNFDTLLEDAYARWSDIGIPKAPTGVELAQHGTLLLDDAFFILKAHGTIHDDESMVFTSEDYRRITHANPAFQAVMGSLMLTRAVLFVGYSLSDPNFRLLMDSQLATFGTDAPPRYALMENVGAAEKAILRRTTGIEVISFPTGAFGEVAGLLRHLAQAAATPPSAPARRRAGPPAALRDLQPMPAAVLRLRTRDIWLENTFFETTTADPAGFAVPLDQTLVGTSCTLDWIGLSAAMNEACGNLGGHDADPARACAIVGPLLAQAVPGFLDWLRGIRRGSTVLLDLAPELWPLPWEWLPVDGEPLCMRHAVCRRMLGLHDASRGRPFVHAPLRVLLIGDAGTSDGASTPHARDKVRSLERILRSALPDATVTRLTGRDASYARVLHEMRSGGYDLVHYAGPSGVGDGGSLLPLRDGQVGAAELVTLLIKRPPALLVLSGCDTGFVPAFTTGFPLDVQHGLSYEDHYRRLRHQRVGFERAAARAGVGTFVAAMGTVQDRSAKALMLRFYEGLLAGLGAAQALHEARPAAGAARTGPRDSTALQVAMAGYADLRLVAPSQVARS